MGLKVKVDPSLDICVFSHLRAIHSLDSSVVLHLLTSDAALATIRMF